MIALVHTSIQTSVLCNRPWAHAFGQLGLVEKEKKFFGIAFLCVSARLNPGFVLAFDRGTNLSFRKRKELNDVGVSQLFPG